VAKGNSKGIGGMMDFAGFVAERLMEELDKEMVRIAVEDEKMPERKVDWRGRKDWYELNKAYKTLGKAANFKVGDKVRILRKAEDFELGWEWSWSSEKDKFVGKVVETDCVYPDGCVAAEGWVFPWFVLELVEPVSEKHTIIVDGKSTEVDDKTYQKVKNLFD
jgi:hypothetical protein